MRLSSLKSKDLFWPLCLMLALLGAWLRFHGQNWDEGQLLHPDERFVFMVVSAIRSVQTWAQYFDTAHSTLNPHNNNFGFYVYGTFPLFLWRLCADLIGTSVPIHLIGRSISAGFDAATCLLVFTGAWILFGRWAGLVAFFVSVTTVLQIQLAHYATFDSYGAFFTTAVLLVTIMICKLPNRITLFLVILAGIFCGLAAATKINFILVFGLVPLSLFISRVSKGSVKAALYSATFSLLALVFLAITFRVFQPYAFIGPGFFDVRFNPKWIENLSSLSGQAKGSVDFPPAVQWYQGSRLHGLINLVTWGFGLPMGLLAMGTLLFACYRTIVNDYRFVLPFTWATVSLAAFCMVSEVQTIRYGAPVYPAFAILVGGMISILLQREQAWLFKKWNFWERAATDIIVALVLISSLLWSIAFTAIYRVENSRIAASRWMMREIPGAINLLGRSNKGVSTFPISISQGKGQIELPLDIVFGVPFDFMADKLSIPEIAGAKDGETFILALSKGKDRLEYAEISSDAQKFELSFSKPLSLRPGEAYQLTLSSKNPTTAFIRRPQLLGESSWDDSLPMRVDGFDPYGGIYNGEVNLEIYWRDPEKKARRLAEALVNADYFYLSSNRQVGTIGRLPKEFPVAALFYQKMLGCSAREYIPRCYAEAKVAERSGQLGFELVKTFESYPKLFGVSFNTQLADESLQVYDHPRTLIFKNRDRLSVEQLEKLLTPVEFGSEQ